MWAPPCYTARSTGQMMFWRLLLAALALSGSAQDADLVCYRKCNQCNFTCKWRAEAASKNATYHLKFCYHSSNSCPLFKTSSTHLSIQYRKMRVLQNLTAWVESHSGGRVNRSQNITLQLENAIKLDPPNQITLNSKSNGTLSITLLKPDDPAVRDRPLQREVQYRQVKDTTWTQVACQTPQENSGNDRTVICHLETAAACEVQIRHKTAHWSSYWSEWSQSIFVPEEILESPVVTWTLGSLGRNGQRNVTFHWQEARVEQGEVSYVLAAHMLACGCEEPEGVISHVKNGTTLSWILSGAEYHVSLSTSNAAGSGPVKTYRIPPEERTEISFLNMSWAGSSVTVQWAAKTNGSLYCFEKQALGEPPEDHGECTHRPFFEQESYVDTVMVQPGRCYRIAIHGLGPEKRWSTFGSMHYFATNASFDGPIHIENVTAISASLHWEPSPLSQCPGTLQKYVICYTSVRDNRRAYHEANSSATHYTLQDLQPDTYYRVGIQAARAELCHPQRLFKTTKLGPNTAEAKLNLPYLSAFLCIPLLAALYHFNRKRAKKVLFPSLPSPIGSQALTFPARDMSQEKPWPGFVEPSEKVSPTEPLVAEFLSGKGEHDVTTETRSLHLYTPGPEEAAELAQTREGQVGSESDLLFEYRRQVLLTPTEEEEEGSEVREPAGVCGQSDFIEAGPGPSQPHMAQGLTEEPAEQSGPLLPLPLLLSDKPIIIKNGGSFELSHQ
ncbi:interleukin-12 receptor subunit beta-1 [Carettochelys insculpta]|uniref:interleukin-12 receptor subunit beta-1 n=1 Tax=Carettochelys insculpta TaxID=44489 RepID=UPI003EBA70DE